MSARWKAGVPVRELRDDGGEDFRVGAAQADEALRGGEAGVVVGAGVGERRKAARR